MGGWSWESQEGTLKSIKAVLDNPLSPNRFL